MSYLGEVAVYSYINSAIEDSNFCTDVMKKHFNKELLVPKEDYEDFEISTKCWICNNVYFNGDNKVRDHCHIPGT